MAVGANSRATLFCRCSVSRRCEGKNNYDAENTHECGSKVVADGSVFDRPPNNHFAVSLRQVPAETFSALQALNDSMRLFGTLWNPKNLARLICRELFKIGASQRV